MKYARLSPENIVLEVFTPPTGFTIDECFHPTLVVQFEPCPLEVQGGWIKNPDGTYTEPVPIEPPTGETP